MSTADAPSHRLVQVCRAMQGVVLVVALVLVAALVFGGVVDKMLDETWTSLAPENQAEVVVSDAKRTFLRALAVVFGLAPLLVLFGLWSVFGAFARGPVISVGSVRTLRMLGAAVLLKALAAIAAKTALVLAMTYDSPPGHRVLTLELSTTQLNDVLFGIMFIVIGHVLTRAVALAEENRLFI